MRNYRFHGYPAPACKLGQKQFLKLSQNIGSLSKRGRNGLFDSSFPKVYTMMYSFSVQCVQAMSAFKMLLVGQNW